MTVNCKGNWRASVRAFNGSPTRSGFLFAKGGGWKEDFRWRRGAVTRPRGPQTGSPAGVGAVSDGAGYTGATALILMTPGQGGDDPDEAGDALPSEAIVLAAPTDDPDGTFAGFVAAFAHRLDARQAPADAWNDTLDALAVDAISSKPVAPGR